jgi:hypothetical protein
MARVPLSPAVARLIAGRVARFPVDAPDRLKWLVGYVAEFGALPLYVGWTETIGIQTDGQFIRWSTEGEYAGALPLEDTNWVVPALVIGVEWYPELRSLLPRRGPEAVDCPCRAHPLLASGKLLCGECGGLGWLPRPDICSPN